VLLCKDNNCPDGKTERKLAYRQRHPKKRQRRARTLWVLSLRVSNVVMRIVTTLGPSPTHRTPGAVARLASSRAVPATGRHNVGGLSRLLARPLLAMGGGLYCAP